LSRLERIAGGPLDPARLERPLVEDEENAASWFLQAADRLKLRAGDTDKLGELSKKPLGHWSDDELAWARAAVADNDEVLLLVARAAQTRGGSLAIRYSDGVQARVPNLVPLLNAAKVATVNAKLALHEGEEATALLMVGSLGSAARGLCGEWATVAVAIGETLGRMQLLVAADLLARADDDAARPSILLQVIEEDPCAGAVERAAVGEALIFVAWGRDPFGQADERKPTQVRDLPEWFVLTPLFREFGVVQLESLIATIERTRTSDFSEAETFGEWNRRRNLIDRQVGVWAPDLDPWIVKEKGAQTARALASVGLELASLRTAGPTPGQRESTPLTGERPVVDRADGWIEVSAPRSEEFWNAYFGDLDDWDPPFTWRVRVQRSPSGVNASRNP
jgi:hypothetical protein